MRPRRSAPSPRSSAFHTTPGFVIAMVAALGVTGAQAPPSAANGQSGRADNYYAAGDRIEIIAPMAGDVIVAGRQIDIVQPVAGDILAAGWRVVLSARADDDVRIAAGEVAVNAPINGDLTVAGGDVTIGPQAHVSGRAFLTGRMVRVEGILDRDLQVAGATVELAGEIRQPVQVTAEKLEILPSARILGPLTYKGASEARIAEGAIINGPITYDRIPEREARRARAFPALSTLLFSIHLFLAGVLIVVFLPRVETSVVATLRAQPGKSLLAGFVLLITTPVAAVLLIVSVLALPIGLALGAFFAVALFVGVIAMALFVGDVEARLLKMGPIVSRGQHALCCSPAY
jgi:ethanolamine utilization microcompartment shell protein EutS